MIGRTDDGVPPVSETAEVTAEVTGAVAFRLAEELGVTIGAELSEADGIHRVYAATVRADGRPCVLKLCRPGTDWVQKEARALRLQDGQGCVALLAERPEGILLERAVPGTPVSAAVGSPAAHRADGGRADDAATERLGVALLAWRRPAEAARADLPHVRTLTADLARGLAGSEAAPEDAVPPSVRSGFAGHVGRVSELLSSLVATPDDGGDVLLHGDLHHDNLLHDDGRGDIAIDPQGHVGPPAYDVGQLLMNPHHLVDGLDDESFAALAHRRLAVLAGVTGIDCEVLEAWAYVKAVVAQAWSFEDDQGVTVAFRLADLLRV